MKVFFVDVSVYTNSTSSVFKITSSVFKSTSSVFKIVIVLCVFLKQGLFDILGILMIPEVMFLCRYKKKSFQIGFSSVS